MKKTYLLAAAILGGTLSFAQLRPANILEKIEAKTNSRIQEMPRISNDDRAGGDVIGAVMDFTTASNWVAANTSSPSADWVIGTSAGTGEFSSELGTISSTSGGNFAMFDSDGLGSAGCVHNSTLTMATGRDFSSINSVIFECESFYRAYYGECFIEVTNNNGTDWVSFQVNGDVAVNTNSENPENIRVNISSVAANQADVKLRFRYEGAWDYVWMIDDAKFIEGENYDLRLEESYFGSVGAYEFPLMYYMVPDEQLTEIKFGQIISNQGAVDQTSVALNVDINGGASVLTSSTLADIITLESDSLITAGYTPSGAGSTHTFLMYANSGDHVEDFTANDTLVLADLNVTDFIYARDADVVDGSIGINTADEFESGNIFDVFADEDMWAIDFKVSTTSEANGSNNPAVKVVLYESTADDFVFIEESEEYTLTSADMSSGAWITLKLKSKQTLSTTKSYLAVVHSVGVGGTGNGFRVATSGESKRSTSYYKNTAGEWFYDTSTPMVRLNFNPTLSIEENQTNVDVAAYPNPASDNVNIVYTLSEASDVNVNVVSVTGEVVYSNNLGTVAAGKYTENINATDLANGVYFYTLTVNGKEITKKLVISKK